MAHCPTCRCEDRKYTSKYHAPCPGKACDGFPTAIELLQKSEYGMCEHCTLVKRKEVEAAGLPPLPRVVHARYTYANKEGDNEKQTAHEPVRAVDGPKLQRVG